MACRGIGVNPQRQVHYLDHLAPICIVVGAPLLFTDEELLDLAQHYYPELHALYLSPEEFGREYLIAHYDLLFMSDLWDRKSFHEKYALLEKKYQKRLRHVHCPHGFSDKGYYLRQCADEDIVLIYGQNMIDLLKNEGVFERLPHYVLTGNYRYTYYKKNRTFYEALYQEEVQARFLKKQKTILYAPTWDDKEGGASFFEAAHELFQKLPETWNMIVKVHPQLEEQEIAEYYRIVGKYEKKPNLLFLKDFPVFPLLAQADVYLGDMSAVGYDFLAFNKPMFFLNQQRRDPKTDRRLYLYRCGIEVCPEAYSQIYPLIEANLEKDAERFGQKRAEVYAYTFGAERPFEQIKKDILAASRTEYIE